MTAPAVLPTRVTTSRPVAHLQCTRCQQAVCGAEGGTTATRTAIACAVCRDVKTAWAHRGECKG